MRELRFPNSLQEITRHYVPLEERQTRIAGAEPMRWIVNIWFSLDLQRDNVIVRA